VVLIGQLTQRNWFTVGIVGPDSTVDALAIVANQAVSGVDDVSRRSVIGFEMDFVRLGEVVFEIQDIGDVGLPPAIDRLIGITDDEQIVPTAGERGDQHVLDLVRVLVFIDEDVPELLLIALQEPVVLIKES
jgi:hypothetical protein